jgi:regulator of sigma E protease
MRVGVNPMRRVGLVMHIGEITAVQANSPAAKAGIMPGDKIVKIVTVDGKEPTDPITLPYELGRHAGQTVTIAVERAGEEKPREFQVTLRPAGAHDPPLDDNSPLDAPSLGVAYRVLNRVRSVNQGSPAEKAGLRLGDEIVAAELLVPEELTDEEQEYEPRKIKLKFDDAHRNWPQLIYLLQDTLPRTRVKLTWTRDDERMTEELEAVADGDWPNPERGFLFKPKYFLEVGESLADSIRLGADETLHATLLVYRFLQKLSTQQVSPRALGGPVTIFKAAKHYAELGFSDLLIFLTLLSANLAVINFLPIPLLDGGHMVLLTWEGIRGKPPSERVQLVLTYIGLAFILSLMMWVLALDFGWISRQ